MNLFFNKKLGKGLVPDIEDKRDLRYDVLGAEAVDVDWEKGFDIEKELNIKIPIKDQNGSSSCVGQAISYYTAVVNAKEIGYYVEQSAKAFYSQIALPGGGSSLRDACSVAVDWGSVSEAMVRSYQESKPPKEDFIKDRSWKNTDIDSVAKPLQAKEYRIILAANNIDLFAKAIRDNLGVLSGVNGANNGSWNQLEPIPGQKIDWRHGLYFGKFGVDEKGKYIATPNSWGNRFNGQWQKLREDWFTSGNMFNCWTLVDKPNQEMTLQNQELVKKFEKKFVIEAEGRGRKGIIINGKLQEIKSERVAEACLYSMAANGNGVFISSDDFNNIIKDINNF
jgi:hypothetical protein